MKKNKELDKIIPEFHAANTAEKEYKKIAGELNIQIKSIMRKAFEKSPEDDTYEVGEYVAKFSMQDRSSMNAEALLEYLKTHVDKDIIKQWKLIKKKEYVDTDVLEDLIYNEKLSKDIISGMESCKIPNSVEVLKVTKKKPKKGE